MPGILVESPRSTKLDFNSEIYLFNFFCYKGRCGYLDYCHHIDWIYRQSLEEDEIYTPYCFLCEKIIDCTHFRKEVFGDHAYFFLAKDITEDEEEIIRKNINKFLHPTAIEEDD